MAAAISKRTYQIVLALCGVLFLWLQVDCLTSISIVTPRLALPPVYHAAAVRIQLAHLDFPNTARPIVTAAGLLLDGCPLNLTALSRAPNGSVFDAHFDLPVDFNGYYLVTGIGPLGKVEVSWSALQPPAPTSKPQPAVDSTRNQSWITSDPATTWLQAGPSMMRFDLRVLLRFWFLKNLRYAVVSTGLFACTAAAAAGHCLASRPISTVTFLVVCALDVATAIGYGPDGPVAAAPNRLYDSQYNWANLPEHFVLALGIWFFESSIFVVTAAYGSIQLARYLAFDQSLGVISRFLVDGGGPSLIMFFWIMGNRAYALCRARRLVIADQIRYNAVWKSISEDQVGFRMLVDLDDAVRAAVDGSDLSFRVSSEGDIIGSGQLPRQLVQLLASGKRLPRENQQSFLLRASKLLASRKHLSSLPPQIPLTNLDVLYVQAVLLQPFLVRKALDWAVASRGLFPRKTDAEQSPQERDMDLLVCPVMETHAAIKWAAIKGVGRACEKMLRVYHGDVSRLLDICRQSIVFNDVPAMTTCVWAIAQDPDVEVLRIKNRLDVSFDSAKSAGYRDVSFNLRIATAETRELGIDLHVCELQLLLRGFYELKVRYSAFLYKTHQIPQEASEKP